MTAPACTLFNRRPQMREQSTSAADRLLATVDDRCCRRCVAIALHVETREVLERRLEAAL